MIAPDRVAEMQQILPAQTDAAVMDQLGISFRTWLKVRGGEPILRSTAVRLLARLSKLTDIPGDPHNDLIPAKTAHSLHRR